ncbi:hypothetical protein [Rhizobium hidalgonense]|uniref:hypothetical protein n=1 Tax=Rhizobium hidalgonense TaxID=1538159 RepID=UPI0011064EC3|nr:hypothetical protein FFM81_030995 [Rhizobium hidalgonense]
METGCAKPWNGSACTIASLFRKPSCSSISTGSRRFQRREPTTFASSWNYPASIPAGAITPILGGVGPMTVASLMHNALVASRGRLAKL